LFTPVHALINTAGTPSGDKYVYTIESRFLGEETVFNLKKEVKSTEKLSYFVILPNV
jgi:hypothetical protein